MQKKVTFKIKGMQRDLSESVFNPEYSYENKNLRIMSTDDNTLLSLVNEKGPKQLEIIGVGSFIEGVPLGQALLDRDFILFTTDNTVEINKDRIYKFWFKDGELNGLELFNGDLNFSMDNPIETVVYYENENIKKVYWTDGLNQPRVINIASSNNVRNAWRNDSFDFIRNLDLKENVTIKRNDLANGIFAPGIIQYTFTYYNKYGQESNIFYTSPLFYTSFKNRGGGPEDSVNNSFTITLSNLDTSFDYVRIYSIQRTSIDSTPSAKRIVDINITEDVITYVDNGTTGDTIDPTKLLFVGGEEAVFGTISHKDNTLFLGNIKLTKKIIDSNTKTFFASQSNNITFSSTKKLELEKPSGYYPYKNQLINNSQEIKSLKYLEYYRFGIQFQHKSGKWSEPIHIGDRQNTSKVLTSLSIQNPSGDIYLPVASLLVNNTSVIQNLIDAGYMKARPVIVYPTINDRSVVCQGVLAPTVYNVQDRFSNSPFAQSSWFTRANSPFDEDRISQDGGSSDFTYPFIKSINSKYGWWKNDFYELDSQGTPLLGINGDGVKTGSYTEFRHNHPIPDNMVRNAEIQCIFNPPDNPYITSEEFNEITSYIQNNTEYFFVDQSIFTFHSPDIEFDERIKSIDSSNLKLRIVGLVPITSTISDIDIQTSTPKLDSKRPGFYKENLGTENLSNLGSKSMNSGGFWIDSSSASASSPEAQYPAAFMVYPWHRNGSLNSDYKRTDSARSAMLDNKKMSNLRYSFNSYYYNQNQVWRAEVDGSNTNTGISGVTIFDLDTQPLIKIPAPKNSTLNDLIYYGNVDKIVNISQSSNKPAYPIILSGTTNNNEPAFKLFRGVMTSVGLPSATSEYWSTDPVRIKYKSTSHAVIALNYTLDGNQRVLPTVYDTDGGVELPVEYVGTDVTNHTFWEKAPNKISQDVLDTPNLSELLGTSNVGYGFLWLAELYNDNVENRFGGNSEEAFENNEWLPCGESVSILNTNNQAQSFTLTWKEGDTYYQRYDHLKTYPYTQEDQNSVVDIVSFMCETRVNLDGRYDRNRGQINNLTITPTNFNLMNDVYSQKNNFFIYRGLNTNRLQLDYFPNTVTWTLSKSAGELIDTWTNITLASTMDLDGDRGVLRAIRRFNNELIAFQDNGISNILFNSRTQIPTSEGVPIEIANSGKVDGKRYISNTIGVINKWSIVESPSGLYFIDDIGKSIYLFNGQLTSISDKFGFHSWINNKSDSLKTWSPLKFENIVSYYDRINGDVFFISGEDCLAFSETMGTFSSFYSYEHSPYFITLEDRGLWVNRSSNEESIKYKIWEHNEGNYNIFFDDYKDYYITLIVNPDPQVTKIFNNLEFRADSFDINNIYLPKETFDSLSVWNEYQYGKSLLVDTKDNVTNLKKKFRAWRVNIPRDKSNKRDRMVNPWLYLKLSKKIENTNKNILHDLIISYLD